MGLAQFFSKQGQPIGRWNYALVAFCLVYSITDFAVRRTPGDHAMLAIDIAFFAICALVWPLATIMRLLELQLSPLWVLPLLAPLAVTVLATYAGWLLEARVVAGIAIVAQLPLMLLSPRKGLQATQSGSSGAQQP